MEFQIILADKRISIHPIYANTELMSKDYICNIGKPDFIITSSSDFINSERSKINNEGKCPNGYLETLAVYRAISETMLDYSTFLMHGSVVAVGNDAFMFTAPSGTGKTTRTKLWIDQVPESFYVNGDKPLLKIQGKNVLACGTPWSGKEHYNTNTMVPLRAIFFLERAEQTSLEPLSFSEAFAPLLKQTYRPDNPELLKKTLTLLKQLDGRVKFYRYYSSLDDANMIQLYQTVMKK